LKITTHIIFITVSLLCSIGQLLGQKELTEPINKIKNEFDEVKNDSILSIKGNIISGSEYVIDPEGNNNLDYRLNAQLQLSYKGIDIPLQFNLSNGRTISNISGPNFRTPSFTNLGISPSKGNWILHLGNRSMDFSKYTYQGLRFKGVGIEYVPEENFEFKAFKGNLSYIDPIENNLFSGLDPPFDREAFGISTKIKTELFETGLIVFQANDKDIKIVNTNLPAENTAIEINGKLNLTEKLNLTVSRSLSALNTNSRLPRENILTHDTAYNMFGLFTKRENSNYSYASDISLNYTIEKYNLSLGYIDIDKDYRSLGTFLFDNNFKATNISISGQPTQKISFNSLLGIRKNKSINLNQQNRNQFQLNQQVNYRATEKLNFVGAYSNVRNTQKIYQRRSTSNIVDSLSIAQISKSIRLGSNYIIDKEKPSQINLSLSWQEGLGIQSDSITVTNQVNNYTFNLTYNTKINNHLFNISSSYLINKNTLFTNKSILFNLVDQWSINDYHSINLRTGYLRLINDFQVINQISLGAEHEWEINDQLSFASLIKIELGKDQSLFQLNTMTTGVEIRWRFTKDKIIKF